MKSDYQSRRYYAAREAYQRDRQGMYTPRGHRSWADWWTAIYGDGETFSEYVSAQMKREAKGKTNE